MHDMAWQSTDPRPKKISIQDLFQCCDASLLAVTLRGSRAPWLMSAVGWQRRAGSLFTRGKLPLSLPFLPHASPTLHPVPWAKIGLWEEDGPHGWVSSFWMALSPLGREGLVVVGRFFIFFAGGISLPTQTAKQTNSQSWTHPWSQKAA